MKGSANQYVTRGRLAVHAGISSFALAVSSAALAQDGNGALDEAWDDGAIIVTATKRETTLQDIPVAVTVTSGETIERAQIRDLNDLQSLVPSLKVGQRQSSANTNFFIRGFGNGANNAGIEPSVGVFIDNVYRSRTASQIADLPDVQRIEVLRGPQSTLFGKNASAGVVSIVTQEPQFELGGNIEASYGNYDAVVVKGVVTGPLTDTLAASFTGAYNRRNGIYRDFGTGNSANERDRWFARGQLLWEPGDRTKVRLIADYGRIDEACCAAVSVLHSDATGAIRAVGGDVNNPDERFDKFIFSNFDSINDIKNYGFSAQVDHDLGDFTLTSITAWRDTDAFTNQDADFSSADLLQRFSQDLGIETFTQEFRVSGNIGDRLTTLLGAYYFDEKIRQHSQVQWGADMRNYSNLLVQGATGGALSIPDLEGTFGGLEGDPTRYLGQFFVPGQGLDERYRLNNEAWSIFSQIDLEITDRLTLTGGVNYTNDKKNFSAIVDSNDVFAGLDLNDPAYGPFRNQLLLAGGLVGAGVDPTDLGAVLAFASNPATAPIFQQITAFADANQNNPLVNPLNQLAPLQFFPPFLSVPNAAETGRTSDDNVSWTARLSFEATDDISVYAGIAKGFKASSVNLSRDSRPPASAQAAIEAAGIGVANQSYGSRVADPEKSTVYEAGVKANFGSARANFAIFKQEIKGFQSNIFTGTGFVLANAGKQSVFGFEFESSFQPVDPLTLGFALTYLDPKYDSFPLSFAGDLSSVPPAGIPEISLTLSADYVHELPNSDERILVHVDFHYEDETQLIEGLPAFVERDPITGAISSFQPALDTADQFTREIENLNASITYAMGNGLELTIWSRNLLNDRHIEQIFDTPAQIGAVTGYPNAPRTFGVGGRFRF